MFELVPEATVPRKVLPVVVSLSIVVVPRVEVAAEKVPEIVVFPALRVAKIVF